MSLIAVVGSGVIGAGWCARFLAAGHGVVVWDPSTGFAERLTSELQHLWPTLVRHGISANASLANLTIADSLGQACSSADFVQESAPEDLQLKKQLHEQIDHATTEEVIIASSSSGLLPSDIQAGCRFPQRILVGHPFNPVYLLPLVETVGGKLTSGQSLEKAEELYRSIGMHPLRVRTEIEGYLSDRLQEAMWREILHLVNDDVATTQELDEAIVYGPGLRWAIMGTCMTFNLAGGGAGMRHMLEQFGPALKLPWTKLQAPELTDALIEKMVEGTQAQAEDRSIAELARLRDDCLIDIMQALGKYQMGAGALFEQRTGKSAHPKSES